MTPDTDWITQAVLYTAAWAVAGLAVRQWLAGRRHHHDHSR